MTTMQGIPTEVQKINDHLKLIPTQDGETFWAEIDGLQIPRLTVANGTMGRYNILLDGRFPCTITGKELYSVLNLVANSMVIAGGFNYLRASGTSAEHRNSA